MKSSGRRGIGKRQVQKPEARGRDDDLCARGGEAKSKIGGLSWGIIIIKCGGKFRNRSSMVRGVE
jgi:hypothetical protein